MPPAHFRRCDNPANKSDSRVRSPSLSKNQTSLEADFALDSGRNLDNAAKLELSAGRTRRHGQDRGVNQVEARGRNAQM